MTGQTEVGHIHIDDCDEYVGRAKGGVTMETAEIGERGWLGNPHVVRDGQSRDEVVRRFRDDFEDRLENDAEFRDAVADLAGKTLGCWCQTVEDDDGPLCHAEVIAEHADRLGGG